MSLITTPNVAQVDAVYQALIDLHQGRDAADSLRVNARLILLLINHIGDSEVIAEAFAIAGQSRADLAVPA
ncbi:MAG TPA: DUF2783 domain-containing protein [Sphingomonas sp.]|jgi:hypothetical protein